MIEEAIVPEISGGVKRETADAPEKPYRIPAVSAWDSRDQPHLKTLADP
jgi:hypothetical protein